MDSSQKNYKQLIGANIQLVMDIYGKTRKDVCSDLGYKYTTFTDYVKGHTYPNIETLNELGYYFRLEGRDFLIDLSKRPDITERLKLYAKNYGIFSGDGHHTFEEYYETPLDYPVELLRGKFWVCESPTIRHQSIVRELTIEFASFIRKRKGNCKVFPGPVDVHLELDEDTVCVPDLLILCDPELIKDGKRCKGAPDLVVEVLSPTGYRKDQVVKRSIYEESGVREYWVVDPFENEVTVYTLDEKTNRYPLEPKKYSFSDSIPVGIYKDFSIKMDDLDL